MAPIEILICAVGLGLLVYRYDIYEREPWFILLLAAGLGAGAYWILSYGEDKILEVLLSGDTLLVSQSAVAGVTEEVYKLLAVLVIALLIPNHFNDPFDGLSLWGNDRTGVRSRELAFYLDLMEPQVAWHSAIAQEVVRQILHLLMGSLSCFGLGLARFRVPRWSLILSGSLAASISLHFAWNYFCDLPAANPAAAVQQRSIAVLLMPTALLLFGFSVVTAFKHSGDTQSVNKLRDLWGWPFSLLANRWQKPQH